MECMVWFRGSLLNNHTVCWRPQALQHLLLLRYDYADYCYC